MSSWMEWFTGARAKSAGNAKERLKLVLIHDRTDLNPEMMERMKDEILSVISRYIDIDPAAVRMNVAHDGREQRLMADIPLRAGRRKKAN
ncbi:MAG: cell division topological specificity factor MinE [Anaerolineaceae bacterium]|nr:cell division topological specificity factor MinE [Anaerolineaceae bacterium]